MSSEILASVLHKQRLTSHSKARLRSIVESKGYKLGDDSQIRGGERPKASPLPSAKSQKPRKRKKSDDGADAGETKVKKPKKANEKLENGMSSAKKCNPSKKGSNLTRIREARNRMLEKLNGDNNSTDSGQPTPTGSEVVVE